MATPPRNRGTANAGQNTDARAGQRQQPNANRADPVSRENDNVQGDRQRSLYEETGSIFEKGDNSLEKVQLNAGLGVFANANAMNMFGFNHRKTYLPTANNSDSQGYVFFTRPDLRLSYDNLAQDRIMALMLNSTPDSVWGWVRATLSPRIASKQFPSPFVDNQNPFIPILTNNLHSLSGWSEITMDPYVSEAGIYNEAISLSDGFSKDYSVKNLNATFSNQIGDPINKLFHVWVRYAMLVKEGIMDPFLPNIILNIVDYQTRIYRIILDPTKRYIQNIAACGAAFPLNTQLAAKFDYDHDKPRQDQSDEVSIQFQTIGMEYDDPILMVEFNALVDGYCPGIKKGEFVKLSDSEKRLYNMIAIPRINMENLKLEWYVSNKDYEFYKGIKG